MANEGDNTNPQSVSVEEYNKLKADFEQLKTDNGNLKTSYEKLEKIFNDRQTKALDREGILKALGLEKAPEKPIADVLNEKFGALTKTVEDLQAQIKTKDEKLALNDKKQKVLELAKPYNFVDTNDVLNVIDFANEDFEGQIKNIAETKKHWIKQKADLGAPFNGASNGAQGDLEAQLAEAEKNGDVALKISLKRQLYERQRI